MLQRYCQIENYQAIIDVSGVNEIVLSLIGFKKIQGLCETAKQILFMLENSIIQLILI